MAINYYSAARRGMNLYDIQRELDDIMFDCGVPDIHEYWNSTMEEFDAIDEFAVVDSFEWENDNGDIYDIVLY